MLLILAFTSDYCRIRFPFIMLGFMLTFIGFIIYAAIDDVQAQLSLAYYACFMMVWGTSAPSVLLSAWYNNNIAHEGRRVVLTSVGVPLANLMGLVSSNIFREQEKPKASHPLAFITSCPLYTRPVAAVSIVNCEVKFLGLLKTNHFNSIKPHLSRRPALERVVV